MKSKILLLVCGLVCCGSIFASEVHTVENMSLIDKTPVTPVRDCSIIFEFSQQFLNSELREEFKSLIEHFAKNPNGLKNVFDEQFGGCHVFSQKEDSLQATLFEQAVKIKMLEARNELLLQSIGSISFQMSQLLNQNVVGRLSGVEQIIGDLQSRVESQKQIIAEQNKTIIKLQEKVTKQDEQNKTIVGLQEDITKIMGKLAALAKESEKLEGGTKTPQAPSVEIPEDLTRDLRSIQETVDRLERQLGEKADRDDFEKLRNSYGSFATIVMALVDQADKGKLDTRIDELNKQKKTNNFKRKE